VPFGQLQRLGGFLRGSAFHQPVHHDQPLWFRQVGNGAGEA